MTNNTALSPVELPLEVLGARICGLASRIAQATFYWLTMVAEFDRRHGWSGVGIKSCAHWLAWTCALSPGTAREHVRVARALQKLPLVSNEMKNGNLSYSKVREITRVSDVVDEARLVTLAKTATASQLSRTIRAFRRSNAERLQQEQTRSVRYFTDTDGSVVIKARVPAEEGALMIAAISAARANSEECLTLADALTTIARAYLNNTREDKSGEDRTTVVVHVDAQTLIAEPEKRSRGNNKSDNLHDQLCEIPTAGGISPGTASRLACDATVIGIIHNGGGALLAHGRSRRLVSAAQRRALTIRDRQCQFPSCERQNFLQAHHIVHWAHGGSTDLHNLILLCRFHHMACHEGGIEITKQQSRLHHRWRFHLPTGEEITPQLFQQEATGWDSEEWLLWRGLDGSAGWHDREAKRIRPRWAGERALLRDMVDLLFRASKTATQSATVAAA